MGLEEAPGDALERRPDRPGGVGISREEQLFECAVAPELVARRHAECDEVPRPVEAVPEALERPCVTPRIEAQDKRGGRRAHHREDSVELAPDEIHAAVRETRGAEHDDLAISLILVEERKSD